MGCTDASGACVPGDQPFACGAFGQPCQACPRPLVCNGGACTGSGCSPLDCPNSCCFSGFCAPPGLSFACGTGGQACQQCPGTAQCIAGVCTGVFFADAGTSSVLGQACTTDSACATLPNGLCFQERFGGTGIPTGYVGGACSVACSPNGTPCTQGTCVQETFTGGGIVTTTDLCRATCPGPRLGQSTCRPGYVCNASAGSLSRGWCGPDCHNAGVTCVGSTRCRQDGYCR